MANYESCTRTNYFAVTDEEKLNDIVAHIKWDGGELDFLDKENGKWVFGGYGSISGLDFNDIKFNDEDDCEADYEEEDEWKNMMNGHLMLFMKLYKRLFHQMMLSLLLKLDMKICATSMHTL